MTKTKTTGTQKTTKVTPATGSDFNDFIGSAMQDAPKSKEKKTPRSYTLSKAATIAIRLLAALNSISKWLETIEKFSKKKILEDILPQFAQHLSDGEAVESMHLETEDKNTKCLVVPMRKYAKISQDNIADLTKLGLIVNSETNYKLTEALSNLLVTHPTLLSELVEAVTTSKVLDDNTKNGFKNGLLTFVEEEHSYSYATDPLDGIGALAKKDTSKALKILEAVKPTYTFRSFEIENKNVEMTNALDIIKTNIGMQVS